MRGVCMREISLVEVGALEFRDELLVKFLENVRGDHVKLKTEVLGLR